MTEHATAGLFYSSLVQQQTKSDVQSDDDTSYARSSRPDPRFDSFAASEARRFPPPLPIETSFRHGGWLASRERVQDALSSARVPESRLERFQRCGADCCIEVAADGSRHRVRACYCGDRFCRPCSIARSRLIGANLEQWLVGVKARFVTLTLRPNGKPLASLLSTLVSSFAKLREQRCWSDNVKGGAYCIEITRGRRGNAWNVHLHALVFGSYIDQRALSDGWKLASGGSFIVDVRAVSDARGGARYVAKYAAKGFGSDVEQDADCLLECVLALRGRRLLGTFGAWRGRRIERPAPDSVEWRKLGSLAAVASAARRGERWAADCFRSLMIRVHHGPDVSRFVRADST